MELELGDDPHMYGPPTLEPTWDEAIERLEARIHRQVLSENLVTDEGVKVEPRQIILDMLKSHGPMNEHQIAVKYRQGIRLGLYPEVNNLPQVVREALVGLCGMEEIERLYIADSPTRPSSTVPQPSNNSYDLRLAALDRAINTLRQSDDVMPSKERADEVLALAQQFAVFLGQANPSVEQRYIEGMRKKGEEIMLPSRPVPKMPSDEPPMSKAGPPYLYGEGSVAPE